MTNLDYDLKSKKMEKVAIEGQQTLDLDLMKERRNKKKENIENDREQGQLEEQRERLQKDKQRLNTQNIELEIEQEKAQKQIEDLRNELQAMNDLVLQE